MGVKTGVRMQLLTSIRDGFDTVDSIVSRTGLVRKQSHENLRHAHTDGMISRTVDDGVSVFSLTGKGLDWLIANGASTEPQDSITPLSSGGSGDTSPAFSSKAAPAQMAGGLRGLMPSASLPQDPTEGALSAEPAPAPEDYAVPAGTPAWVGVDMATQPSKAVMIDPIAISLAEMASLAEDSLDQYIRSSADPELRRLLRQVNACSAAAAAYREAMRS